MKRSTVVNLEVEGYLPYYSKILDNSQEYIISCALCANLISKEDLEAEGSEGKKVRVNAHIYVTENI